MYLRGVLKEHCRNVRRSGDNMFAAINNECQASTRYKGRQGQQVIGVYRAAERRCDGGQDCVWCLKRAKVYETDIAIEFAREATAQFDGYSRLSYATRTHDRYKSTR
jgi:hypothetical protein